LLLLLAPLNLLNDDDEIGCGLEHLLCCNRDFLTGIRDRNEADFLS
jgi:hypothetical protein